MSRWENDKMKLDTIIHDMNEKTVKICFSSTVQLSSAHTREKNPLKSFHISPPVQQTWMFLVYGSQKTILYSLWLLFQLTMHDFRG